MVLAAAAIGLLALALDQSTGEPKEWGGGFRGYGRRAASTLWLPGKAHRRDLHHKRISDGSKAIGLSRLVNLLQEFWPEIRHVTFRRQ